VSSDTSGASQQQVTVERAPPRLSQVVSLVAGVFGAVLTTPFALLATPFGLAGVVALASGLFVTHSRRLLSVGAGSILFGAILTGAYGAVPTELMMIGVIATVLAWDTGRYGFSVGEQLGRKTDSRRLQLVHVAASVLVLSSVSGFAYAVSLVAATGRPASAVGLAVLGIVLTTVLLR